jgi:hypothetical protein
LELFDEFGEFYFDVVVYVFFYKFCVGEDVVIVMVVVLVLEMLVWVCGMFDVLVYCLVFCGVIFVCVVWM